MYYAWTESSDVLLEKNKDWYRVVDKVRYELTEKATQQAKESFELYKNELELRKKGIYA